MPYFGNFFYKQRVKILSDTIGLACGDVFLHGRIFVIKVFSSESIEETYSATDV